MTGSGETPSSNQPNFALFTASLLAQVGCFTFIMVAVAIGGGLWLDTQFGTKPIFTILLVLASVPVTFYFLIRMVLRGTSKLRDTSQVGSNQEPIEEGNRGRTA